MRKKLRLTPGLKCAPQTWPSVAMTASRTKKNEPHSDHAQRVVALLSVTIAPQPAKTSAKVPMASAAARRPSAGSV